MKYIDERDPFFGTPVVELTRHNLEVLLARLDDPDSDRMIVDREHKIAVRAVEDVEHAQTARTAFMLKTQGW